MNVNHGLAFVLMLLLGGAVRAADPVAVASPAVVESVPDLMKEAKVLFDSNFKGRWSSYATDGIEKAAAIYRRIAAMPEASNPDRLAAFAALANCQLECMDLAGANATLDEAIKLPGLKDTELVTAKRNKADALYRQLAFDQALPIYREIKQDGRVVDILRRQGKVDEAEKLLIAGNCGSLGMANFHADNGRTEQAEKLYGEIIANKANPIKERSEAVEKLLMIQESKKDYKALAEVAERHISALIAENASAWDLYSNLYRGIVEPSGKVREGRQDAGTNPEYMAWLTGKLLVSPRVSPMERFKISESLFGRLRDRKDLAGMKGAATAILAMPPDAKIVSPEARLKYQLVLVILGSNGRDAGVVNKVKAVLKACEIKDDDLQANADALLLAARLAMQVPYEAVAKTLYAAREKMLVKEEHRSLACTFLENAPRDISSFMNSAYFKEKKNRGVLDRKYGDNVKFLLETDAALTGRTVTEKNADFVPTEFVATCDADAIRLFFFATVTAEKAKAFADGLAPLGGYEMYLAAGTDAPYHCYLIDLPPNGMTDDFVTQYNNKNFRRARQKENTAKIEHQVFDNGVATLLTLSWSAFFNAIPKDGDEWAFEPLHWEQGGYSWGGSQSVHNRSSFGSLVFANMTPANVNAIKRRLIPVAVAAYRKELSSQNGYVEIWQDPELGDRPFYLEVVKPLTDRLDSDLAKVNPAMTAEDVERLYAETVPSWMNIKYIVADLRSDYLDSRRMASE